MRAKIVGCVVGALMLGGCALQQGAGKLASLPAEVIESARCASETLAVDTEFPAGALESCSVDGAGSIAIIIAPEDAPPINCSPWYAFRVTPAVPTEITVELSYSACGHRYWPKISHDGKTWTALGEDQVTVTEIDGRKSAQIRLSADGRPVFIAAQEIVLPEDYDTWLGELAAHPAARRGVLGQSAEGRTIGMLEIAEGGSVQRETVVLVGRQHPPELTGALAMFPFVEALLGDDQLARAYRARFETIVIPLLNPDGVVRGHWRHGTGGADLNRDWGMFTQPEIALMGNLLARIESDPARELTLFIDFHSTQRDVVYTLSKELETAPAGFTDAWLADYAARLPGYAVIEEPGYSAGRGVSKNWVYEAYGVPTATFEIGDETDRDLVRKLGIAAAQAMMKTLLQTPQETPLEAGRENETPR